MTADPTITAALRAAAFATCDREAEVICECMVNNLSPCATRVERDAAAIAAFLRALPAKHGLRQRAVFFMVEDGWGGAGIAPVAGAEDFASLAAAVEEAARDV